MEENNGKTISDKGGLQSQWSWNNVCSASVFECTYSCVCVRNHIFNDSRLLKLPKSYKLILNFKCDLFIARNCKNRTFFF